MLPLKMLNVVVAGAMSDSHPETLTDPEHSDQAGMASSPPQSGDEIKSKDHRAKDSDRKSKLFNKDNYKAGQQVMDRISQTMKQRQSGDRNDKNHGHSNTYKVSFYTNLKDVPRNWLRYSSNIAA